MTTPVSDTTINPRHTVKELGSDSWEQVPLDFATAPDAACLAQLALMLRWHDWTYNYADDQRHYRRGQAQAGAIHNAMACMKLRGIDPTPLWEAHLAKRNG